MFNSKHVSHNFGYPWIHNWQKAMGNWDKLQPEQNYVQYLKQHTGYLPVTYVLFRFFWPVTYLTDYMIFWPLCYFFYHGLKNDFLQLLTFIVFNLLVCVELHYYYLFLSPFCGIYWWLLKWWGRRPEFWGWSLSGMRQQICVTYPRYPLEDRYGIVRNS